jgi:hypothetical protein
MRSPRLLLGRRPPRLAHVTALPGLFGFLGLLLLGILQILSLCTALCTAACTAHLDPHRSPDAASAEDADLAWLSGDDASTGDPDDDATFAAPDGPSHAEDASVSVASGMDAASTSSPDAAFDGACTQPLGPGDLVIDELMIESVAGTGDDGEWLEVASTVSCAANLNGLHGECPVGAKVHTFDVTQDLWLPPGGTFVVADSVDPAVNHYLPGVVVPWSGQPGDVLRNLGGTVTLSAGQQIVVSLTWPSLKPVVGASVELPSDCPASDEEDFTEWQQAVASWFPAFHGTPNAPNLDVACR